MAEQLNLFDYLTMGAKKRKPCEYSFNRYIGQRVELLNGEKGTVCGIGPYYTHVMTSKGIMVGDPSTMAPIEEVDT